MAKARNMDKERKKAVKLFKKILKNGTALSSLGLLIERCDGSVGSLLKYRVRQRIKQMKRRG